MHRPSDIFPLLLSTGNRLPAIARWLLDEVWSPDRFNSTNAESYLQQGETMVHQAEELILSTAPSVYDELVAASCKGRGLIEFLLPKTAILVLDGVSLRELPLLSKLAESTGCTIIERGCAYSALPSDSLAFIEQRILGKRAAPSDLPRRQELKQNGVIVHYYDAPTRSVNLADTSSPYLLWSRFPDATYQDMGAKFSTHFEEIQRLYDTVWKNIVLEIPRGYRVIVTSDHGYIFFGTGLERKESGNAASFLQHDRFRFLGEDEEVPRDQQGLQIIPEKRLAMLRGRIKNRPKGPAANNAYRHGGLSLMEMLTPWLVIQR